MRVAQTYQEQTTTGEWCLATCALQIPDGPAVELLVRFPAGLADGKLEDREVEVVTDHGANPGRCHVQHRDDAVTRFDEGRLGALRQARGYLARLGIRRDVVVTDGIRYRLYAADQGFEPVAYANLIRLKSSALALFERMSRP